MSNFSRAKVQRLISHYIKEQDENYLRQIDAFQTLISSGTVTKTASLLEISQPAVNRLISDLEKGAGFKLFNKVGRRLEPTLEANSLAEEVAHRCQG